MCEMQFAFASEFRSTVLSAHRFRDDLSLRRKAKRSGLTADVGGRGTVPLPPW